MRALTLLSFRDIVVLKTDISSALDTCSKSIPPEITQMLLVLQSTHKTPPNSQFYELLTLVGKVVHPYLCMEPPPNRDDSKIIFIQYTNRSYIQNIDLRWGSKNVFVYKTR